MSQSCTVEEEKQLAEGESEGNEDHTIPSDDEDDCEGYFLEPVGGVVNIAEKIAEANKKLLEEEVEEEDESRPRKVQFSEDVVNFEPNYYSDDECTESAQNSIISEEDSELKLSQDESEKVKAEMEPSGDLEQLGENKAIEEEIPEEIAEDIQTEIASIAEDIPENVMERNSKFILVLLPKDQNSSCESIIGEDIPKEKVLEDKVPETEKPMRTKIARPKSAKKSWEVSKISPNLGCSSHMERRSWGAARNLSAKSKGKVEEEEKKNVFLGEIKVQIKGRLLKKVNIDDLSLEDVTKVETLKRCGSRPKSCVRGRSNADVADVENRPKSAPMRRTCCVIKTELPSYNGLRSEYGLSAEQLQERKRKALESRQMKKQEQVRKRQEEIRKRSENEETFQKWLLNKTKRNFKKKTVKPTDTLTRSDVYIQTHASYAANRSVPYSLDCSITRKINRRKREIQGKKSKTILVEKLFENTTPHFRRSFNIYLGLK